MAPPSSRLRGLWVSPGLLCGDRGPSARGLGARGAAGAAASPAGVGRAGNLAALYLPAKNLSLWCGLTQTTIFLCPYWLSFLGLAGEMEQPRGAAARPVSHPAWT